MWLCNPVILPCKDKNIHANASFLVMCWGFAESLDVSPLLWVLLLSISIVILMCWKSRIWIIPFMTVVSLQCFAPAATIRLSCHVHKWQRSHKIFPDNKRNFYLIRMNSNTMIRNIPRIYYKIIALVISITLFNLLISSLYHQWFVQPYAYERD